MAAPKMSRAQRGVLSQLAAGQSVSMVDGLYFVGDQPLARNLVIQLVVTGWVSLPFLALPLFNTPPQPGLITDAGRAALSWSLSNA
jgi:hypothetical protein